MQQQEAGKREEQCFSRIKERRKSLVLCRHINLVFLSTDGSHSPLVQSVRSRYRAQNRLTHDRIPSDCATLESRERERQPWQ